MKKAFIALFAFCVPALAMAAAPPDGSSMGMEERLAALEARQSELYHTLAEKKGAGLASSLTERLTFSGLLEVEASATRHRYAAGESVSASDLAVATVQFGLGAELNDKLRGNVSVLFEEDAGTLDIDEATIDYTSGNWSLRLGRQYLPFGAYHSHFISDPLTLTLGETRETALLVGYTHGTATLSAFVFNGDVDMVGSEDHLNDWGASLVMTPAEGIEYGASFLSDLADSDAELLTAYSRRVGGYSAYVHLEQNDLSLEAEYLAALRAFAAADLDADSNGHGERPQAWNLEAAWALNPALELSVRCEGSSGFAGEPKQQYGIGASWSPVENTSLSLEYLHGIFAQALSADEDGNTLDRRDLIVAQLAVEF